VLSLPAAFFDYHRQSLNITIPLSIARMLRRTRAKNVCDLGIPMCALRGDVCSLIFNFSEPASLRLTEADDAVAVHPVLVDLPARVMRALVTQRTAWTVESAILRRRHSARGDDDVERAARAPKLVAVLVTDVAAARGPVVLRNRTDHHDETELTDNLQIWRMQERFRSAPSSVGLHFTEVCRQRSSMR